MSENQSQQQQAPSQQQTQQPQQNIPPAQSLEQKKKRLEQKYKKESQIFKKKYMPLVRFALKHRLKIKTARCGNVRIQYFRVNQMNELLEQNKQKVEKDKQIKLLSTQWEKDVVYFKRPQHTPKLRYPKQLQKSQGNAKQKFASFKFDTAEPKTWLFPVILIGIIAAVLFPLWPYSLKYGIFLICLYLLIAVAAVIILRLILYILCAIFGVSFWLFPNFFADCTIIQSFIPFFSVRRWDSGIFSIVGRLLAFLIIGYYGYHLYVDPSWVFENINITKTSIDDLHDWGVSKIKGEKNFSQSALTNLKDIMNQTEVDVDQSINLDGYQENLEYQEKIDHQRQQRQEQQMHQKQQIQVQI